MKNMWEVVVPYGADVKKFILNVLLFTCLISMVGFGLYYVVKLPEITNYRNQVEVSEYSVVSLQKAYLTQRIDSVRYDLSYVKDMKLLTDLFETEEEALYEDLIVRLNIEFQNFITVNPEYSQLRYINSDGKEILRINQAHGEAEIIEETALQNKGDRYYFIETMALEINDIYQSRMDLNMENGVVEIPEKPTIRFAMKVQDQKGHDKGIVIINYDATSMLETFNSLSTNSVGNSYLVNSDGYYLAGHGEDDFSFMYPENGDTGFFVNFPAEWTHINDHVKEDELLQFYDLQHLHTAVDVVMGQGKTHEIHWYIISNISEDISPYMTAASPLSMVVKGYLGLWYLIIPILILSWSLTVVVTTRKLHLASITEMAEIDYLTGTFSRNAGLKVISSGLAYAQKNQMDYALCFIDLNDLKYVNDTFGHDAGDDYLKDTTLIVKSCFRGADQLIRMGGDEFLIGLNGNGDVIERNWLQVINKIEEINEKGDRSYTISLSHGVSSAYEDSIYDLDQLIVLADERMYKEKRKIKGLD